MNVKWMLRQNHSGQTSALGWFLCHGSLFFNEGNEEQKPLISTEVSFPPPPPPFCSA